MFQKCYVTLDYRRRDHRNTRANFKFLWSLLMSLSNTQNTIFIMTQRPDVQRIPQRVNGHPINIYIYSGNYSQEISELPCEQILFMEINLKIKRSIDYLFSKCNMNCISDPYNSGFFLLHRNRSNNLYTKLETVSVDNNTIIDNTILIPSRWNKKKILWND